MKWMRKLSIGLLALAIMATGSLALAQGEDVVIAPDGELIIGVSAAFSGEGLAPFGNNIRNGAVLGHMNRPTATVGGAEFAIELDPQDSQCNAEGGVAVATRYTSDPNVVGVVGPMCSSACQPAAPHLRRRRFHHHQPQLHCHDPQQKRLHQLQPHRRL